MEKKLYRIKSGKVLGGVCNGIAEYFNIDVTIVRLLFVLALLLSGIGILLYVILWIIVPEKPVNTPVDTEVKNE